MNIFNMKKTKTFDIITIISPQDELHIRIKSTRSFSLLPLNHSEVGRALPILSLWLCCRFLLDERNTMNRFDLRRYGGRCDFPLFNITLDKFHCLDFLFGASG